MNSALIAVDPKVSDDINFKRFSNLIKMFQEKGLIPESSVLSVIYPALYPVPMKWYFEMKQKFQKETIQALLKIGTRKFSFFETKVLISHSSVTEDIVDQLS